MAFPEFKAGALTVRSKTIPARKQFHVVRRLAPLLGQLSEILPLLKDVRGKDIKALGGNLDALTDAEAGVLLSAAGAFGKALAGLPDEDADYVLDVALSAAEVKQDGGDWAALRVNGAAMFPLDLAGELIVAFHVLQANLAGFMAALPATGLAAGRNRRPMGG